MFVKREAVKFPFLYAFKHNAPLSYFCGFCVLLRPLTNKYLNYEEDFVSVGYVADDDCLQP